MAEEVAGRRVWIALTETSYVEAFWYVELKHPDGNWLGCVYRDAADQPWRGTSRFRWYIDDKVEGSADRRSGAQITKRGATGDTARAELVATFDAVAADLEAADPANKRWTVVIRGGLDAVEAAQASLPWMHVERS